MDLSHLNPSQRAAVEYDGKSLLLLAGAGTGKTETLTSRIAYMIKERGIPARHIVAMTFTNKAAREMKERAARLTGISPAELNIGTFHSLCASILRQFHADVGIPPGFRILDARDSLFLTKKVCGEMRLDDAMNAVQKHKHAIDAWKNEGLQWNDVKETRDNKETLDVYRCYTRVCRDEDVVDFGDLLILVVENLRKNAVFKGKCLARFRHILVDEFQDTNKVQMDLVKGLAPPASEHHTVTVVGDDYQCIHEWRGATVDNILKFEVHYPGVSVIGLGVNYRCTPIIVAASSAVIANNARQRHKELVAAPGSELRQVPIKVVAFEEEKDECAAIVKRIREAGEEAYGETAILYRTNAQSRSFEIALHDALVPYEVKGACSFFERAEIKDVLAYVRLVAGGGGTGSDADLLRVVNTPPRRIGKQTVEKLAKHAAEKGQSLMDALASGAVKHAGLGAFQKLLAGLRDHLQDDTGVRGLFEAVIERTGYVTYLKKGTDEENNIQRIANVGELVRSVKEYEDSEETPSVADYLDRVTLFRSEFDEGGGAASADPTKKMCVQLMTLHSAKGLEFERVFMVSCCNGVLPHSYAIKEGDIDAERRLCYVGMTRAKTHLTMSWSAERVVWGKTERGEPSVFLGEIPGEYVKERSG